MNRNKLRRMIRKSAGLPLVYLGVVLLLLHFLLRPESNVPLCIALALEAAGIVSHYRDIRAGKGG